MRYECPRSFALVAAVLAVLATGYSAADDTRQTNAASPPAGEIRVIGSAEVEVSDQDDAVQSPATPKTSVPTPAKRKPDASPTTADVAAKAESVKQPALAPEPAVQPKDAAVNGSLEPVPDALDAGPVALEAASFKGVTPGATTKEEVEKAWGKPKDTRRQDDTLVQLYSVEPFKVVEVSYAGDKVPRSSSASTNLSRRRRGQATRPGDDPAGARSPTNWAKSSVSPIPSAACCSRSSRATSRARPR